MSVRQTSIDAFTYHQNTGVLSKRRLELYIVLCGMGLRPATSNEVYRAHKLTYGSSKDINQSNVSARLGELRDLGVIFEATTKDCPVTGRSAIGWDVTNKVADPSLLKSRKIKRSAEDERLRSLAIAEDEFLNTHDMVVRAVIKRIIDRIASGD